MQWESRPTRHLTLILEVQCVANVYSVYNGSLIASYTNTGYVGGDASDIDTGGGNAPHAQRAHRLVANAGMMGVGITIVPAAVRCQCLQRLQRLVDRKLHEHGLHRRGRQRHRPKRRGRHGQRGDGSADASSGGECSNDGRRHHHRSCDRRLLAQQPD